MLHNCGAACTRERRICDRLGRGEKLAVRVDIASKPTKLWAAEPKVKLVRLITPGTPDPMAHTWQTTGLGVSYRSITDPVRDRVQAWTAENPEFLRCLDALSLAFAIEPRA